VPSHSAQELRGFFPVSGADPAQRAIATVDADGVDRNHVDLGVGQLADHIGDRAHTIVPLDQERSPRTHDLPTMCARDFLERRRIGRKEIQLCAPASRKSRERPEIDTRLLERAQHLRAFADLVRHFKVEIVEFLNGFCHGTSSGGGDYLPHHITADDGRRADELDRACGASYVYGYTT